MRCQKQIKMEWKKYRFGTYNIEFYTFHSMLGNGYIYIFARASKIRRKLIFNLFFNFWKLMLKLIFLNYWAIFVPTCEKAVKRLITRAFKIIAFKRHLSHNKTWKYGCHWRKSKHFYISQIITQIFNEFPHNKINKKKIFSIYIWLLNNFQLAVIHI